MIVREDSMALNGRGAYGKPALPRQRAQLVPDVQQTQQEPSSSPNRLLVAQVAPKGDSNSGAWWEIAS